MLLILSLFPPPVTVSPSGRREPAGVARVTARDPVVSAVPARHSLAGLPGGGWGAWGLPQPPPPTHGPTGAGPQPTRSVHSVMEESTSTVCSTSLFQLASYMTSLIKVASVALASVYLDWL